MDKQIRYLPDETGINKSNRVENEPHKLHKQVANRIIVPLYGCFFSDSVIVRDKFKRKVLKYKEDYVFGGLRVNYTTLTGKEVASFIVILNDNVSDSILIDYQAFGALPVSNTEAIADLLEMAFVEDKNIPFVKLLDVPKELTPSFHYHDLGDIDRMEYLLFTLEKIRIAIQFSQKELLKFIYVFDQLLQTLLSKSLTEFETELYKRMMEYTNSFKKELFGLGLLQNISLMTKAEGRNVPLGQYPDVTRKHEEKYFSLQALVGFSQSIYSLMVDSDKTGLGSPTTFTVEPSIQAFEELPIGSGFVINPLAHFAGDTSVEKFYPDRLELDNSYFVKKLTTRQENLTPLFFYVGRDSSKAFVMSLIKNDEKYTTKFVRIAPTSDSTVIFEELHKHLEDYNNPHLDDKRDVDLSQVENLPLASMEDIICNIPARRYMTLRTLFSYMKRFKTGKKEVSEIYENYSDKSITRKLQTIFSPCGTWRNDIDESAIELCKVIEKPQPAPWSVEPDKNLIKITLQRVTTSTTTTTTTTTTRAPIPVTWTITSTVERDIYNDTNLGDPLIVEANNSVYFTVKGFHIVVPISGRLSLVGTGINADTFIGDHGIGPVFNTFTVNDSETVYETHLADMSNLVNGSKFKLVLHDNISGRQLSESEEYTIFVPTTTTTTTTTQPPMADIKFDFTVDLTDAEKFDVVTFTATARNLPGPKYYQIGFGAPSTILNGKQFFHSPTWIKSNWGDSNTVGKVFYPNTPISFKVKLSEIFAYKTDPSYINGFSLILSHDATAFSQPGYNIVDNKTHESSAVRVHRTPGAIFCGFKDEEALEKYQVKYERNWPPPNQAYVGKFHYYQAPFDESDFSLTESGSDGYISPKITPQLHMHPQDDRIITLSLLLRQYNTDTPNDYSDITWEYYQHGMDMTDGYVDPCDGPPWWDPYRGYDKFQDHRVLLPTNHPLRKIVVSNSGKFINFAMPNPGMDVIDEAMCARGTVGYIVFYKGKWELGALEVEISSKNNHGRRALFGVFHVATHRDPNP